MNDGFVHSRVRRWRWRHVAVAAAALVLLAVVIASTILLRRANGWAREQTVTFLANFFDSEVDLEDFEVQVGLVVRARGRNLALRHKGRRDVPPLIVINAFDIATSLRNVFRNPRRIDYVELDGLQFNIPPRYSQDEERFPGATPPSQKPERPPAPTAAPKPAAPRRTIKGRTPSPIVISQVVAREATMTIVPKDDSKTPKTWVIHALMMSEVAPDLAIPFSADIDNPIPRGKVITTGSFGPWASGEPSLTPLEGSYTLADADLDTIKGVGGTVSTTGTFTGVLERIEATGTSGSPDFHLDAAGQPVALETRYVSVIDGTNANVWLDPVDAVLGKGTPVHATGGIVKVTRDSPGRTVDLSVTIDDGRVEDVLRLVMKSATPFMTGGLKTTGKLLIPPGDVPVARKLRLDGRFSLHDAQFASDLVQGKVDELSRRAQGQPTATEIKDVLSDFSGTYRVRNGTVTFSSLRFTTQGARVQLAGHYHIDGNMNFTGSIRMDAGVSQMVTGKKRFFLKMFDPLFKNEGATEFPIHISGSVQKPEFGVDVKKTLRRALLPGGN